MNKRILKHFTAGGLWDTALFTLTRTKDWAASKEHLKSFAYIRDGKIDTELLLNSDIQFGYYLYKQPITDELTSAITMTSEGVTTVFAELIVHHTKADSAERLHALSKAALWHLNRIAVRKINMFQIDSEAAIRYADGLFEGKIFLLDILEGKPVLHFDEPGMKPVPMTTQQNYHLCDKVIAEYRTSLNKDSFNEFVLMATNPTRQ